MLDELKKSRDVGNTNWQPFFNDKETKEKNYFTFIPRKFLSFKINFNFF